MPSDRISSFLITGSARKCNRHARDLHDRWSGGPCLLRRGARARRVHYAGGMGKKGTTGKEAQSTPPPVAGRPSALLDTRVIYCGDCLEQLRNLPDTCASQDVGSLACTWRKEYDVRRRLVSHAHGI